MAGKAHRPVIGEAQPLQQHHPAAWPDTEPAGDGRVCRDLLELQHAPGRLLVVPADPFREPGARLDRVFQHVLGDKRAAALLDADQAGTGQFLQRAAHGVAVDAEMLRQLGLGRQLRAGLVGAGGDIVLQGGGNLPPQRHAVLARHGDRRLALAVSRERHRKFIHGPVDPRQACLDGYSAPGLAV